MFIHYSAIEFSEQRLRVAIINTIDMLVRIMNANNATESIFSHITFYKDGSLQINCGMKQNNSTINISLVKPWSNVEICDHSTSLRNLKNIGVKN